jgi:hypothetical protein
VDAPAFEVALLDVTPDAPASEPCVDSVTFDASVVIAAEVTMPPAAETVCEDPAPVMSPDTRWHAQVDTREGGGGEAAERKRAGNHRPAADELTLLADMGFRVTLPADAKPVIDWTRKPEPPQDALPARSSWNRDFVSGLGERPGGRHANLEVSLKSKR